MNHCKALAVVQSISELSQHIKQHSDRVHRPSAEHSVR
jgi:hypothetical protein